MNASAHVPCTPLIALQVPTALLCAMWPTGKVAKASATRVGVDAALNDRPRIRIMIHRKPGGGESHAPIPRDPRN